MNSVNSENYAQRDIRNSRQVLTWSVLWSMSLVLACLVIKFWWPHNNLALAIYITVHLLCALGALKAHQTWLKGLDELQQKIQLHSMSFTLGLAWIGIILLLLLSSTGVLDIGNFHLAVLTVVMLVAGVLGNVIGIRKSS